MTTRAIRQFIAICGGQQVAKGSVYAEPSRRPIREPFVMGQSDYIAVSLTHSNSDVGWSLPNLFPYDTIEARMWASGKMHERRIELFVVQAYAHAARRGRTV